MAMVQQKKTKQANSSSNLLNPHCHLLDTKGLSVEDIQAFLKLANTHKQFLKNNPCNKKQGVLTGQVVVNLFVENSTRTRSSFELAAKYLGAEVLNFDVTTSAFKKGETLLDTLNNLMAMHVDAFVIRHPESGILHGLQSSIQNKACLINAGDGRHEHPSQGLLDTMTMLEVCGELNNKKVVIVGDILHSRVARSNIHILNKLGAKVTLCGPPSLLPSAFSELGVAVEYDLTQALTGADFVMTLRLQLERQESGLISSLNEYIEHYGINHERLKLAQPSVKILHPGPMNRDVEITSALADDLKYSLILEQVNNGVAMRMAIIETLLKKREALLH